MPDSKPFIHVHPEVSGSVRERFVSHVRRRLRWRAVPAYPAASIFALTGLCTIDLLIEPSSVPLEFLVFLAGLVGFIGAVHGALWQVVTYGLARLPRRFRIMLWLLGGISGGGWLASALDVWVKLSGRHAPLAWGVLAICAAGGLGLGAWAAWMQPTRGSPLGGVGGWPRGVRVAAAIGLLGSGVGLSWVDRTWYEGLYPEAHAALRFVALWSVMWAAVVVAGRRLPRLTLPRAATVVGLAVLSLLMLDDSRGRSLQAFVTRPWPAAVLSSAQALTDLDRDGYSAILAGGDCAPLNASVHPGAREVPGNGIDDNCVWGDAAPEKDPSRAAVKMPDSVPPMDILLITVDTLRPDHMGMYNAEHASGRLRTTPFLDAWARDAVIFDRAYTSGGWTSIAIGSLLRGRYPRRLQWALYSETNRYAMLRKASKKKLRKGEHFTKTFPFPVPDSHRTIAQWMKQRGMQTAAVVNDGFSEVLRKGMGSNRGFDRYEVVNPGRPHHTDRRVAWQLRRIMKKAEPDQPLFLWAHFFGPHTPDTRHAGIPEYPDTVRGRYNHEIRYLDGSLRRLLNDLESLRERRVAVFVTSDHGEIFIPSGRVHGTDAREASLRIPMLARVPGWEPQRIDTPVSLVDLLPTMLSLTGSSLPAGLDGDDWSAWIEGRRPAPESRILISDTWRYGMDGKPDLDLTAAYDGNRKIVYDRLQHSLLAFDQRRPSAPARPVDRVVDDPLTRTLFGYLDETGGALKLVE